MTYPLPVILFDPKCSLCLHVKQLIGRFDRNHHFTMVSIYDAHIFEQFDNLSFDECYGKVHVIDQEENVWVGGDAVEFILKTLAPHPLVVRAMELSAVRSGLHLGYDLLNAYRLKRSPPCEKCRP
jgi:predicted DCC family thiol-disulfide oxidoreductase YuxK